jgi:hypothetical protein
MTLKITPNAIKKESKDQLKPHYDAADLNSDGLDQAPMSCGDKGIYPRLKTAK